MQLLATGLPLTLTVILTLTLTLTLTRKAAMAATAIVPVSGAATSHDEEPDIPCSKVRLDTLGTSRHQRV
jgi:hypothetical protein